MYIFIPLKYTTYTCTCTATLYILFRTSYIKTMTAKWRIHNPENRYDAQTGKNILLKYINNTSYIMITESLVTIRPGINSSQVKCHRNWQNTMYTTIVLKYLSKENSIYTIYICMIPINSHGSILNCSWI